MIPTWTDWSPEGRFIAERAIDAHGGWDRWLAMTSIQLSVGRVSGLLPALKGHGRTHPGPGRVDVQPHRGMAHFHDFPDAAHRGRYDNGAVSIEHEATRQTVLMSADHRMTFQGPAKYRRWQPLDALYFFGYALCHYHALPFTLGSARFRRIFRAGRSSVGIDVEFSETLATHCRRQTIFFGRDGRITRHDYTADVVGQWAKGCHFWLDYERAGGLLVARRRRVLARFLGHPIPLTVLDAEIRDIACLQE